MAQDLLEAFAVDETAKRQRATAPSRFLCCSSRDRIRIRFAGFEFGERYEGNHAAIGSIGSGKSIIIDRWTLDAARASFPGSGNLTFIFDMKGDGPEKLKGEGIPFLYLNLSDLRSASISINAGGDVEKIAAIIEPFLMKDAKNPFWENVQRTMILSMARSLDKLGKLSFSNLYRVATLHTGLLTELFALHPSNAMFERLTWRPADEKLRGNILAGVSAALDRFALAAAHDYYAPTTIDLQQELEEGGVILVGIDMQSIAVTLPWYQTIFNLLTALILSLPNNRTEKVFISIDEFPVFQRLESIPLLLATGRSKNCHVAWGVQQIKQLETYYSEGEIAAILDNSEHCCFCKSSEPASERWLAQKLGEALLPQVSYNLGHASYGKTISYSHRSRLVPGALGRLKTPSPENGVEFYFTSRYLDPRAVPYRLPGDWVEVHKPKRDRTFPNLVRKPASMKIVPAMTDAEADELLREVPIKELIVNLPTPGNEFERFVFQEVRAYIDSLTEEALATLMRERHI